MKDFFLLNRTQARIPGDARTSGTGKPGVATTGLHCRKSPGQAGLASPKTDRMQQQRAWIRTSRCRIRSQWTIVCFALAPAACRSSLGIELAAYYHGDIQIPRRNRHRSGHRVSEGAGRLLTVCVDIAYARPQQGTAAIGLPREASSDNIAAAPCFVKLSRWHSSAFYAAAPGGARHDEKRND